MSPPSRFPPFQTLSADALDTAGDTLASIERGDILGVIVQGVYSPRQALRLYHRFRDHEAPPFRAEWPSYAKEQEPPHELGMALFSSSGELEPYLERAAAHRAFLDQVFDEIPHLQPTLEQIFSALGAGMTVELAPGGDADEGYCPGTVRMMPPGGGLEIHVGLDLQNTPAVAPLRPLLDVSIQFSYFLTLRAVDEGGELVIYALDWPQVLRRVDDPDLLVKPGDLIVRGDAAAFVRGLHNLRLRPQPGDLLVFNGGHWYHEVSDPVGDTRCTLGGFLAYTRDRDRILYWA